MSSALIKFSYLLIPLFFLLGIFLFPQSTFAFSPACDACLAREDFEVCFPYDCASDFAACPYLSWNDTSLSECEANLSSPNNVCTGQSGSDSPCGYLGPWNWCRATGCQEKASILRGACDYQYKYSYTNCGAYDSCQGGYYLYAGQCGSSGCMVGGLYKTCCDSDGTVDGNCTVTGNNGFYDYGVCPGGSITVMCGVSGGTCNAVCGGDPCVQPSTGIWCTSRSCGESACNIFRVPTLTPTPTPTPTPTSPPSDCSTPPCQNWSWKTPGYDGYCCTGNYCAANTCVGVPWRCVAGTWENLNPSGECAYGYCTGCSQGVTPPPTQPPPSGYCPSGRAKPECSDWWNCNWLSCTGASPQCVGGCCSCPVVRPPGSTPEYRVWYQVRNVTVGETWVYPSDYPQSNIHFETAGRPVPEPRDEDERGRLYAFSNYETYAKPGDIIEYRITTRNMDGEQASYQVRAPFANSDSWTNPTSYGNIKDNTISLAGGSFCCGSTGDNTFDPTKMSCAWNNSCNFCGCCAYGTYIGGSDPSFVGYVCGGGGGRWPGSTGANNFVVKIKEGAAPSNGAFVGLAFATDMDPSTWTEIRRYSGIARVIIGPSPPSLTCSDVVLAPSSLSLSIGGTGTVVVSSVSTSDGSGLASVNRVDFVSDSTAIATVTSPDTSGPSFTTTVTGVSGGTTTVRATATLTNGATCSSSTPVQVTIRPPDPWFQTKGGDVHAQGEIFSFIPSTVPLVSRYFSLSADGYPGLVSYGASAEFGSGLISEKNWLANSLFSSAKSTFAYFYQKLDSPTVDNFKDGSGKRYCDEVVCPTPAGTTIYYVNGDLNIQYNRNWDVPSGSKIVVLVNGNLNINIPGNRKITVASGGFLGLIVKGNINISGNMGDKSLGPFTGTNAHLQGIYLADGVIDTYQPDPAGGPGLGSGFRLVGAGLFYGKGGISLDRDLKNDPLATLQNSKDPAELFIFRPDLVLNAPKELWSSKMSWLEVAP